MIPIFHLCGELDMDIEQLWHFMKTNRVGGETIAIFDEDDNCIGQLEVSMDFWEVTKDDESLLFAEWHGDDPAKRALEAMGVS